MYDLKIYRGVRKITKIEEKKIEEELTCRFKIDKRNLTNFDPTTRKSKIFVF